MKNLFLFALLTLATASSTFATEVNKVNRTTRQNFAREYSEASNVTWIQRATFTKAEFTIEGKQMEAFYDLAGNIIGTSKRIELSELPVSAKRQFAKRYANYTVIEAIRFEGVTEGAYFISAEAVGNSVIIKVSDSGSLTTFEKSVK